LKLNELKNQAVRAEAFGKQEPGCYGIKKDSPRELSFVWCIKYFYTVIQSPLSLFLLFFPVESL